MNKNSSQLDLLMGIWKFRENVPQAELVKVAEKWAEDARYIQLYIRRVSKDQFGIGFTYQLEDQDIKAGHEEYFENFSDQLKRQFGNDLVGWDIANVSQVIK